MAPKRQCVGATLRPAPAPPPRKAPRVQFSTVKNCTLGEMWGWKPRRKVGGGSPGQRVGGSAGGEGGVEGGLGGLEGQLAHELQGLGGTEEAVHAGVLPLHRQRAVVADVVEHAEGVLPRHVAAAGADEVPAPARVGPRQVGAEAPVAAVEPALGVLAVDVEDLVLEVEQEGDRVQVLPHEVAGVPVQAEGLAVPDGLQRAVRSEEHTSELQSRGQLVCRLLLVKKNIISILNSNK